MSIQVLPSSTVAVPIYNADSASNNPDISRNVYALTRTDDFFDLLQDRLHAAAENLLFRGNPEFSIILNCLNRREYKKINRTEDVELVYAGIKKQRELLEGWGRAKPELNTDWATLEATKLDSTKAKVGSGYYAKFKKGEYGLKDIKVNKLQDYFDAEPSDSGEAMLQGWRCERAILSAYFDLKEDLYISLPLIGFGDFDGIAHIVFKKEWEERVRDLDNIWAILRVFAMEYDGMFLDWDVVGDNMEKISSIKEFLDLVEQADFYERKNKNPLLQELDMLNYYKRHDQYFHLRFQLSDGVPGKIYELYLVHAIVSILVDSYAHNVSAHSLTTLTWWFRQRASRWQGEDITWKDVFELLEADELNSDAVAQLKEIFEAYDPARPKGTQTEPASSVRKEDGDPMVRYRGHLSREIYPMFQFLMEKGAYWSGITRNVNVGGMVSSLYNILWHDFMQNPLYIGTIAKTEDIQHVRLRVVVYAPASEGLDAPSDPAVPIQKRILHDGILAEVNLLEPKTKEEARDASSGPRDEPSSVFVREGEGSQRLKEPLKNVRIFLPGGVVGKHALFTMLENEVRNVKHYNRQALATLREQGLTLAIGVQPCSLPGSSQMELYRLSIWLDASSELAGEQGGDHVILKKWKSLEGELFDSHIVPKLGGTYQDKVCAAMLFNNSFSSVQNGFDSVHRPSDRDSTRDRLFYPWALPACSAPDAAGTAQQHLDFEFIRDKTRLPPLSKEDRKAQDPARDAKLQELVETFPREGYLKKVFHVWKGQNLLDAAAIGSLSEENPARFRIVQLPKGSAGFEGKLAELRRQCGVIRIISTELPDMPGKDPEIAELQRFLDACCHWLSGWLAQPIAVFKLLKDTHDHRMWVLDSRVAGKPQFFDFSANDFLTPGIKEKLAPYEAYAAQNPLEAISEIAHRGDAVGLPEQEVTWYRRHGVYEKYFQEPIPGQGEKAELLKSLRAIEFMETMLTRVCIFDNRIYHRVRGQKDAGRAAFFRHRLKLVVHNEATDDKQQNPEWLKNWENERRDFIPKCHFLVMHLSFIDRILQQKYGKEGDIGFFIEQELQRAMPNGKIPDNFILVITTGRGRNDWWKFLDKPQYKDFARFTIFRPVESLITAVERSISMHDDVELKYRLVKILFGS
jgi:hypothetical protein